MYVRITVCHCIVILMCICSCYAKTISMTYHLKEHSEIGFMIGDIRSSDKLVEDPSFDGSLFEFKMLKVSEHVSLNGGKLFVKGDIDREKICTKSSQCCCIELLVFVYVKQVQTDYLEIRIVIDDINDHTPVWSQGKIVVNIPEHTKIGTKYRLPAAVDLDSSEKYSVTKYHLEYPDKKMKSMLSLVFNYNSRERFLHQLWLKVDDDIDREKVETMELQLVAEDSGKPALSGSIQLIVNVTDINDNEPYFDNSFTEVNIKENNLPNSFLCRIVAKDKDVSDVNKLVYSLGYSLSQEDLSKFHIDERTGKIFVKKSLDYESDPTAFYLPIQVTDGSNVAESTLVVKVVNENDNAPIITILPHVNSTKSALLIPENTLPAITLATVTVTDIDNRTTTISCWSTLAGFNLQKIDSELGSLTKYLLSLTKSLDRESEDTMKVTVTCHDDGLPQQTSEKKLTIQVLDRNDCVPQFVRATATITIDENLPKGTFITRVNGSDCDIGINAQLVYGIEEAVSDLFVIDRTSGVIRTNSVFDREKVAEFRVIVNVYDRNNETTLSPSDKVLSSSTILRVLIRDVNDCAPVFNKVLYEFTILEESLPRMYVGAVTAEDCDVELENRQVTFAMTVKPYEKKRFFSQNYFHVSVDGGIYTTNRILDRELFDMFSFSIEAKDKLNSKNVVIVDVVIKIEDVNDNHPQWIYPATTELHVNISQDEAEGRIITVLRATDADIKENSDLNFEITQGNEFGLFRLDRKSGSLYMANALSNKVPDLIRMTVKVTDSGKIPLSNTTTLKIRILREPSWLSFEGRHLDKDLVVMLCMISVTLIVSGILVVAIVLLKCKHCYRSNNQEVTIVKDNRSGNPDGRSSPTISELDNSPQKMSSDMSLYHGHVCHQSGSLYEPQPTLMGFQPLNKPDNLPLFYTLKSRSSLSEPTSIDSECYQEKHSPQVVSFNNPHYSITPNYRTQTGPLQCDSIAMQYIKYQSPPLMTTSITTTDPNVLCHPNYTIDPFIYPHNNPSDRKATASVKWSDLVMQDKGVYESFCPNNSRPSDSNQMSKDQITSFV